MVFKLIAKNTTYYFNYLNQTHSINFQSKEEVFVVAGVIDAWIYLAQQSITIDEIIQAAYRSRFNTITLIPYYIDLYDGLALLEAPNNPFLNFVLTLEALILSADNPRMNPNIILNTIKNKMKVVEKTIEKYKIKKIPSTIAINTEKILPSVDIESIKSKLKNIQNK